MRWWAGLAAISSIAARVAWPRLAMAYCLRGVAGAGAIAGCVVPHHRAQPLQTIWQNRNLPYPAKVFREAISGLSARNIWPMRRRYTVTRYLVAKVSPAAS